MEWDVQKCFVPRTALTSIEFCSSNFVRNITIICSLYGLVSTSFISLFRTWCSVSVFSHFCYMGFGAATENK